jgi:hypothetical protein
MTLLEALKNITPGEVISCGNSDEIDFVEIFALQDGSLRFSDSTMEINSKNIGSKEWVK